MIDRLNEILLNIITNKIIYRGHVITILYFH